MILTQVNPGHIGLKTLMWRRVSGEITTLERSWRIFQNHGTQNTTKGMARARTAWACPPGGLSRAMSSSSTSPGGREAALLLGEGALARMKSYHLYSS